MGDVGPSGKFRWKVQGGSHQYTERNGCITDRESRVSRSDRRLDVWRAIWNDAEMF